MKNRLFLAKAILLSSTLFFALSGHPQAPAPAPAAPKTILEMKAGMEKLLAPSSDQVTIIRSTDANAPGIIVTIQPGKDEYPGVTLKPGAPWDLSAFGHVEARATNLGSKQLGLSLRVDGEGPWQDNPWNGSSATIEPGKTATATTIFGYSWGNPGYAVKPKAITQILLFTGKSDVPQSFRIEMLQAGGPAGEKLPEKPANPDDKRLKPANGVLFGAQVKEDAMPWVGGQNAQATMGMSEIKVGNKIERQQSFLITLPAAKDNSAAIIKPREGRWDLRDALQVLVRVRNEGKVPITPRARVESNGGASDWATIAAPLAPGASAEIAIPFASATIKDLGKKETQDRFTSDAVSAITITADKAGAERVLSVQSVRAVMPPAPKLPAWLGKRPPVAGDWVKTLAEEFNGTALDKSLWDNEGANYYDKASHWSKDDLIVGGGVARLRYEKKSGFHNDSPTEAKTDYAAGFLSSYGKWTQRYGYFECRMKLPGAPGLWPAFWMMPDRGVAAGPEQWKRGATENGGMEFDIMEQLTRWGPNRYNIAQHWDGYGKDHKSNGSDSIYIQPDKDGFITAGLLWTPGSAIYYCNGAEVARWEDARISSVPSHFLFTLPQGGWDNSPLDDARLPDDYIIDYVRVWQRKDLASPGDGKMAPIAAPAK